MSQEIGCVRCRKQKLIAGAVVSVPRLILRVSDLHIHQDGERCEGHDDKQQKSRRGRSIRPAGNNSMLMPVLKTFNRAANPSGHTNSPVLAKLTSSDEYHQRHRLYMTKWPWVDGPDFTKKERLL